MTDILAKNKKKFQDVVMSNNELELNSNDSDAHKCYIKCQICGYLEKDSISNHLKDIHRIPYEEYRKKFPSSPIGEDWIQRID